MKQFFFLLIFLFLYSPNFYSQSILDLYPTYFASFGKIYGESIERINGREDQILNYDQESFHIYKDSIENPEAIKNVEIEFTKDLDLQQAFNDLALFPNLFYLKLSNMKLFSDEVYLDLPEDFSGIKNVQLLHLMGDFGWDFQELSNHLNKLPRLEHLAINGLAKDKFSQLDLDKLRQIKGLYLSGRHGTTIPEEINKMTNLEGIIISADHYPDFQEQFSKLQDLPSLKQMRLLYFQMEEGDEEVFRGFGDLERLELTNVEVKDLNKFVKVFPPKNNLKHLEIFGSKSDHFTEGITRFRSLEHLRLERLGDNINFPEDIFELKDLKVLMLSDNENFTSLSSKIGNLKNLEKLTLYFNSLEHLPKELGLLEGLEYLNLKHNNLETLPESLGNLAALETLILDSNRLRIVPGSIGKLTDLVELDLNNNRLSNLPQSFPQLIHLQILRLNANDIKFLPAKFGNLEELRELYLDQNLLQELPSSFSHLESLEFLSLRNNHLSTLPSFKKLHALSEFIISNHSRNANISYYDASWNRSRVDSTRVPRKNNMISQLPSGFADLEKLERIDISENPIETEAFWMDIKNLRSSKYLLRAENSGIKFLPEKGWGNILAESISLRNNLIQSVPADIINAPFLKGLDISHNPFFLSGNYETKEKLAVVLHEANLLPERMLKRTSGTAKAYLDLSYDRNNRENRLEFMKKAFKIDSFYTKSNIRKTEYAEALLEEGEYQHSIEIFTQAIQQDTASRVRILNFTVPLFENRAEAYLSLGDTLSAINDLQIVSENFSAGKWGEAGLLARKINNDSLAENIFQSGVDEYERQIKWNKENDRNNYGVQLSKLELLIIAEEFVRAQDYYRNLLQEELKSLRNEILLEYFGLILEDISEDLSRIKIQQFRQKVIDREVNVSGWSFELFQKWLHQTDLPEEKVSKMEELTGILKE